MADLTALLQDLGECMATKSDASQSTQSEEDDRLLSRFRSVLPVLFNSYFLGENEEIKEREILAILKLVRHTVDRYPGVLYHGKAHAVLPIVSRIIPLFAEPAASACYDCLFETLHSLVSLLAKKDWEVFRKVFVDATMLVEDLVSVGSFFSTAAVRLTTSTTVSVKAFEESLSGLQDTERFMPPSRWESPGCAGLSIEVTGNPRWQPLTLYAIKLVAAFIKDEAFRVRGLVTSSFMFSVGASMCYSSSSLHKACFELFQVGSSTLDPDVIPGEKAIISLLSILTLTKSDLPAYRNAAYDSSLGSCLLSLYTVSTQNTVESTAGIFLDVFPTTMRNTASRDLKVSLCDIMSIILRQCPEYSSSVLNSLWLIFIPEIISPFSYCLQLALSTLKFEDGTKSPAKRRKVNDGKQKEADSPTRFLQEFIDRLGKEESTRMQHGNLLAGYCVLLRTDCKIHYHRQLLQHFCPWLMSFKTKGLEKLLTKFQLSVLLEVIDNLLLDPGAADVPESTLMQVKEPVMHILELPWSGLQETHWKARIYALKILSKNKYPRHFAAHSLLERGLKDENVRVRSAAIACFPMVMKSLDASETIKLCELLRESHKDCEQVREALAATAGPVFCVNASNLVSTLDMSSQDREACKVLCLVCDNGIVPKTSFPETTEQGSSFHNFWKPIVLKFLFEDSSHRVQTAMIRSLSRLLTHSTVSELEKSRDVWLQCLDIFPVHPDPSVRETFRSQISYFIEDRMWSSSREEGGYEVLGKLRHALVSVKDLDVAGTVAETVAEVAKFAKCDELRVFAVVVLIEQLDNPDLCTRVMTVKLIFDIAQSRWPADGNKCITKMVDNMSKGLFEYLSGRLVNRPSIVKEFAEAVMKVQISDLLKQMVPVVLPKLILEQEHDGKALGTLNALAAALDTSLPLLLLEWCHKVLSVLLLRANGKELMGALQFYETQTGSDPCEIFTLVMPALLDELVRFLGDTGSEEAMKRSSRVGPMIQEVARIVTGSDDLSDFLRHHFVGLLNSIDRTLLRSEDVGSKGQALRCIARLLEMIGSHLTAFVPKINALLTQALQYGLYDESLSVWLFFVKRLARVSPASLKAVASQVVVALMPCLESEQSLTIKSAVVVLEELIIVHKRILGKQVSELPLLPSLPQLAAVNKVLTEARGSLSLRGQLIRAAEGLKHESLSLRHVTATELLKLLTSRRNDITKLILGEAPSDSDAISSLVRGLLRGCAEESRTSVGQKFKLACAECLGGLGAIDPVKLQINLPHCSKMEQADEDLVFQLINQHLTRVLRAASDTHVQDAAALAIQELLKLTGCQEAREASGTRNSKQKNKGSETLWNRFSEGVKEIITPCLTSKYLLKDSGAPVPAGAIYQQGISFRRWMYLWSRRLLTQVTGSRTPIFTACKGLLRHDMDTALYILPYMILDVACNGSKEACTGVADEILAVLSEAASTNDASSSRNGQQPIYLNNSFFCSGDEVSIQTVFLLLDRLGQWINDSKQRLNMMKATQRQAKDKDKEREKEKESAAIQQVVQLLATIPKQTLASASYRCHAFARALLYYESYVREKHGALNPAAAVVSAAFEEQDIGFLLNIYAGLDEPDGLLGLAHLQKRASLQDQVLINKRSGNWAEALTFCEQALELQPKSVFWQSGVLDCLLNMGHFQAVVTHVGGLLVRLPESRREWNMRAVQAAWRLGQWDLIDEYVHGCEQEAGVTSTSDNDASFDLSLARILQALRSKDQFKFYEQLIHSRAALLAPLAAASMESYVRAYPVIVKLHMLREIEEFFAVTVSPDASETSEDENKSAIGSLVEDWNGRLKMTLPSLSTREPILALRRLLFSSCNMQSDMANSWLQFARLCRTSGHVETANRAILQAQAAGAPNARIERAKLLWVTKKSHRAINEVQQVLTGVPSAVLGKACEAALGGLVQNLSQPSDENVSTSDRSDIARTLLLLGRWAHETGQKQKEDVISIYTKVKDLQPTWGKGYFYMAKYFDDLLVDAKKRQEEHQTTRSGDKPWWSYLPDVILYYAKALHQSHHHLFQALPRLLTLWFEFGSAYHADNIGSNRILRAAQVKVMSIMRGCLQDLPTYQWLASLPQLVSRICHDNEEVVVIVKQIIEAVLRSYPQQALWTMAAVSRSDVTERRQVAGEIIQAAKAASRNEERAVFIEFAAFIDQMIRLCFAAGPNPKARSLTLSSSEFGTLKRMMPLQIIMPVQRALTLTLPANGLTDASYNPFPTGDCVTIAGIRDEVGILASLQRPKKVVLVASDGTEHPFLCKPKDDLRKDARMMEFTGMINRLLSKDPSSRRRKLYIRTFAVIPLTEDCGMVEWVLHTRALRHILQQLYTTYGNFNKETHVTVKNTYDSFQGKITATELMRDKILPMFPPIWHRWFLDTFPEPAAWFQSRLAYAHTTAVWSMVGHIVGLGDRHAENILFDSTTGDCVHVDFSCLFDRGLHLEKPELVPFRLTQNMVDGLGITGYQGVFLRTCEITLAVLRAHRETLMSVLETFIHDPLVEWSKFHKSSGTEVQNPHAQRALANIEARLQGVVVGVAAAPSLPLSVEGQAQRLILEAVAHENLGHMYIWWMPWF